MIIRILPLLLLPLIGIAQPNSPAEMPIIVNTVSEILLSEINQNTQDSLEEIKVRWKKADLENCDGLPCVSVTAPGSPSNVTVVVGNAQATASFTVPSTGGSTITGYTVTSTPDSLTGIGLNSSIIVTGLSNGTSYTFSVVATNAMGNSSPSTASSAVTPSAPFLCGTSTISDIDNNSYNTVLIGTQCWTKQNLKVTKYNDGTNIPEITSGGTWAISTGARTVYNHLPGNLSTYGYLYNWYAVDDARKICPAGWHVPSDVEWTSFTNYNMSSWLVAGDKLKSRGDNVAGTGLWDPTNTGTDKYGFTALPGGYRYEDGNFYLIKIGAKFWSDAQTSGTNASTLEIAKIFPYAPSGNKSKATGASVRCLIN
jgi:uncharacterized protein (TIGR02145 family)